MDTTRHAATGTLCKTRPRMAAPGTSAHSVSVVRHVEGDRHEGIVQEGGRAVHFAARLPGFDIEADGYLKTGDVACLDIRIPGVPGPEQGLLAARICRHFNRLREEALHAKRTP